MARLSPGFMLFQNLKILNQLAAKSNILYRVSLFLILFYNIELWFYSCTKGGRQRLCKNFDKNGYFLDIVNQVNTCTEKTARIFSVVSCEAHTLNEC